MIRELCYGRYVTIESVEAGFRYDDRTDWTPLRGILVSAPH